MSVRRSGSGGDWEYSGHEVQHIHHDVDWLATADAGPSNTIDNVQRWEVTDRGLERDELAELRAVKVSFSLQQVGDPSSQDEAGSVRAFLDGGFNLSGDEFLSLGPSTAQIDDDNSGTNDYRISTKSSGEQGLLFADRIAGNPGFYEGASGAGGAAGFPNVHYFLDFGEHFGTGPVLDVNDDFVTRIELDVNNMVAGVGATAGVSLYYVLHEFEGGRPEFGHHHHGHGH